ncbi:MAG: fibronectin type III domain-containing protein [Myxococcota bacterium]|nr:fibronectin type III domain-containing protein [Myxococcota bacterium]
MGTPLATTLDTLTFGDVASEAQHHLNAAFGPVVATVAPLPSDPPASAPSDVVAGALASSARRLLPRTPNGDYYGGSMSFDLAVDPVAQNYFTIKIWGSDAAASWLVLNVNGFEVGWRHPYLLTDEEILLNQGGWYPGRFIYRTVRIPWQLTRAQTKVTVTLRSLGSIFYYGGPAYDNYQHRMTAPTPPVYRAYTHRGPELDVSSEAQGAPPPATRATTTAADAAAWIAQWQTRVNAQLAPKLTTAPTSLTSDDLDFIAQAYDVSWTAAYHDPAAVTQVIAGIDALATAYAAAPATYLAQKFADHGGNGGWGGYFGQVGDAIRLLWPELQAAMPATGNYGGTLGTTTRRAAWGAALRASVDFGRFNRKTISNQDMDCARRIYMANAGLLLVDGSQALNDAEARRYVYEAYGVQPYLGSDQPGGGPVPVRGTAPYGPSWYMTTTAGTTKEGCLVGGDYGEQGAAGFAFATRMGGDALLEAQTLKMLRARAALRYPAVDSKGHMTSVAMEPVGCRNDQEVGAHTVYLGNGRVDDVFVASRGASSVGDDLVGYLQQEVAEGQLAPTLSSWLPGYAGWDGVAYLPSYESAFAAQAQTGVVLPMTSGQPDFAWADDENMVIAAKHGEERFWTALDWHGADAMNRLAKVFAMAPGWARVAEVTLDDVQYVPTGGFVTRSGAVEGLVPFTPPDHPINANQGLVLPVALRPDLATPPATNRDGGRGTGYTLRYGHWLVAIDAHPTASYAMATPAGFSGGVDLVSKRVVATPVTLAPRSVMVFYLSTDALSAIAPATPVVIHASGTAGSITVTWDAVPGAVAYRVRRALATGGPFATVAPSVATTTYTDTGVVAGTPYQYVVAGVAADGTAGTASPPVSATP